MFSPVKYFSDLIHRRGANERILKLTGATILNVLFPGAAKVSSAALHKASASNDLMKMSHGGFLYEAFNYYAALTGWSSPNDIYELNGNQPNISLDVRKTIRKDARTGIYHPVSYQIERLDICDLRRMWDFAQEAKRRHRGIIKFVSEANIANPKDNKNKALVSQIEYTREDMAGQEVNDINQLLDSILCIDFFASNPGILNSDFETFAGAMRENIQENLVYELEYDDELCMNPSENTVGFESLQEHYANIYSLGVKNKDGSRTCSTQKAKNHYLGEVLAALTGPHANLLALIENRA